MALTNLLDAQGVLDGLQYEQNPLAGSWTKRPEFAENIGKATATGYTTITASQSSGAVRSIAGATNFAAGFTIGVLPAENGQVLAGGWSGGKAGRFYLFRESATLCFAALEVNGVEVATGAGKTWAVGDQWRVAYYEGSFYLMRKAGGTWTEVLKFTTAAEGVPAEIFIAFGAEGLSSTAARMTDAVGSALGLVVPVQTPNTFGPGELRFLPGFQSPAQPAPAEVVVSANILTMMP